VDQLGNPDSLFEKARALLIRLPPWMLPKGFNVKTHCKSMQILNPENRSVITGEAGDNIGRGGRNTVYVVDEAAFLERAESVEAALSANADTIIWVSTVNGPGSLFQRKIYSGQLPIFEFAWHEDPRKNQDWYDKKKRELSPEVFASEVEMDPTASQEGIVILGKWVRAAIDAHIKLNWDLEEMHGIPCAAADIAAGGDNYTVFGVHNGPMVYGLRDSNEDNTTRNAWQLADWARSEAATTLSYDAQGVGIGIKSAFNLMDQDTLGFVTNGILGGASPSNYRWPDRKNSKQMFRNRRAELYWMLRERFRKTYEAVNGI
jgi:hypothetical protein